MVWFLLTQLRLYFLGSIYVFCEPYILLNYIPIFLLFCSVWVPQIITNTLYGYKDGPGLRYAIVTSAHCAGLPLYFKVTTKNFMMLKPDYLFAGSMVFWITIQILCLQIQKTNPRFLLTKGMRAYMLQGFYRYEKTFDEEALISNGSYYSNLSQLRDLPLPLKQQEK